MGNAAPKNPSGLRRRHCVRFDRPGKKYDSDVLNSCADNSFDRISVYLAIPDNIRRNHKGTYWIGVSSKLTFISKTLIKHPFLRQIVAALISQSLFYRYASTVLKILVHCLYFMPMGS